MKTIDRHLLRELVTFTLLACLSVVTIYLIIDLFEELNYFASRKAGLVVTLLYYFYSLPATISLLYPVSMVLAVFVVYGRMTRFREFHALQSAGVRPLRLFAPALGLGVASAVLYLIANEAVAIPANARLSDLRRLRIEKRQQPAVTTSANLHFVGDGGRVYYVRELESSGKMRDFSVSFLGPDRRVVRRYDVGEAQWLGSSWLGRGVVTRTFLPDGREQTASSDSLVLADVTDPPAAFAAVPRPVEETPTRVLRDYIARMRRAGENVAREEVEYHYRFSYSLIGLVVVLLGLPLSVWLRKGGVMFGLGLGLLLSFVYWGAIQTCRAYGTSHVVSPALAAWLPNLVFGSAALLMLANAERS
jgi:LPS export ABC transporter permease LptG